MKYLDWEKAERFCVEHPDLEIWAGLRGDMGNTGGEVFNKGVWITDSYVYDRSCWATPILEYVIYNEDKDEWDEKEIECWTYEEHEHNGIPEWWGRKQAT